MPKPQVVFFGTGPVAAKSLELLSQHCEIEAVITKPQPPHHRGLFPVIETAQKLRLPVVYAADKQELEVVVAKNTFRSRVGILIDYGIIVSRQVIDAFPLGIINSHFSLLPEWRGADPISFAILSGQKMTGVSLMLIDEGLDTGPLLAQAEYKIRDDETMISLTVQLIKLSDELLQRELPLYLAGQLASEPQHGTPTYSRKLTKEDGKIDWQKPATQLEREIRAFQLWPKSYTKLGSIDVAITKAHAVPTTSHHPGYIEVNQDVGSMNIYTADGYLSIESLQPAGKKEMPIRAFLSGYQDKIGTQAA